MSWQLVDHIETGFADGGTGHNVTMGSAGLGQAGDFDVLFVGSDTTVPNPPTGFQLKASWVSNAGGYAYVRACTGGESATVAVTTNGDHNTVALLQRWRGGASFDVAAFAHVDNAGGAASPAVSIDPAGAAELVVFASTNTDNITTAPSAPSVGAYTLIGSALQGAAGGATTVWGIAGYRTDGDGSPESPAASWSGGQFRNRYVFALAFVASTTVDAAAALDLTFTLSATASVNRPQTVSTLEAAVQAITDALISHAKALGRFAAVNGMEPKSAPGTKMTMGIWGQFIGPAIGASGLAATTARLVWNGRIYQNALMQPEDAIDPKVIGAASAYIARLTGDLSLGGLCRQIDLLGQFGPPLQAEAGYIPQDNKWFRVYTLTIPVIVNDAWGQAE